MVDEADRDGAERRGGMDRLAEDATGFGLLEIRTAWATVVRPRQALEAWMTAGPTGGGTLARPLRLYLALAGLMMLLMFLQGGMDSVLLRMSPPELGAELEKAIAGTGKSLDAFLADFDGWASLVLVPLTSLFIAFAVAPLLRWWDPENLGWRRSLRATFAFMCAAYVPMLPFTWFAYQPEHGLWTTALTWLLSLVAFLRMGAGRWWRNPVLGAVKAAFLATVIFVASVIAYVPVMLIGALGAIFGP